jgi:NADH:ubiquinone oxidoreductase subunit F (NADH-binding)
VGRGKLRPCPSGPGPRILRRIRGRRLQTALATWPVAVIQEVARSGLRGRGGARFPTGAKWRAVRAVGTGPRLVVGNAAEGEPATFKDRLLLRTNLYQVLEGLAIAAYAVGAERAYVGLKETFTTEIQALRRALGRCGTRTRSAAFKSRSSSARICTCWGRRPGWKR